MFFDARTIVDDLPDQFDVCIVGAGIAGLVCARRLAKTGLTVWLLESGQHKVKPDAQSLNAGRSNHADYPFLSSRVRAFGGTSTRWVGACVPLDPVDYDQRDWVPNSGWPIGPQDVAPYLEEARCDFGIDPDKSYQDMLDRGPFKHPDIQSKTVAYSAPLNLGTRYYDLISKSQNIHCLLNATVSEIYPSQSGARVERVDIAVPGRATKTVSPRIVVLAAGGIENARLLLASNSVQPRGLGNRHDVVGRYHMEHPIRTVGILPIGEQGRQMLPFTNQSTTDTGKLQGTFGLSTAARAREKLLDLHIRCYRYSTLEDEQPIIDGKHALLAGTPLKRLRSLTTLRPATLKYLGWHAANKLWRNARFDHLRFMAFLEQEPDPENRVTLSTEKDTFGRPLPYLRFHESALMSESVKRSMAVMADALAQAGFPGLRHGADALSHLQDYNAYGLHQMGATRMHADPRFGVVDKDCRVHGLSNLFVTGSSVFTTGGAANPSWMIAALSLRVADEIQEEICYT